MVTIMIREKACAREELGLHVVLVSPPGERYGERERDVCVYIYIYIYMYYA